MGDHCHSFEDLLFEPNEALSEEDNSKLTQHLSKCEVCRAERELFLESWNALEELQVDSEAPTQVRARVWEQIRAEEECREPAPIIPSKTARKLSLQLQKLAVAGIALTLGFGLGKGLRAQETTVPLAHSRPPVSSPAPSNSGDFIDQDLIELASQEGYSVEIFPENTDFSPIDQEMMSALAPSPREKTWLQKRRGSVVPVQYISQGGHSP